jgi:hypothetical protein
MTQGKPRASRAKLGSPTAVLLYVALADFVFHMIIAGNYGYFRDELYYIVAGERLAFGYVDFPPVIALLAALMNGIAGDSLVSIHVIPALAASAIVFLAGMIARELGGGLRAQLLAAVAAMFSAAFAVASIFSMDILDMLWWTILAFLLVRILRRENRDPKLWLIFGLIAGIGLMTKLTIAFFLLSVLVAVLFVKRSYLKSPWFWIAAVIALAIVSPYVAWNALNGWPTVDFFIHHGGLNGGGPLSFLGNQILIAGFLGLPLAMLGLYFFFTTKPRPYALLGLVFVILLAIFTVTNGKPYFIMGVYPFMFAGGAVLLEKRRRVWSGYLAGIVLVGVVLAPLYAPVLPPQTFVKFYGGLTGTANGASAQQNAGAFPQYLGDRFGWDTMAVNVAQVYDNLPAREQSQACILTVNYGEASALTFLGKPYHLPPVISGHNNYYLWGPGKCSGAVLILVGFYPGQIENYFRNLTIAGNITCSYCMTNENNLPVIVVTGENAIVQNSWLQLKHFD